MDFYIVKFHLCLYLFIYLIRLINFVIKTFFFNSYTCFAIKQLHLREQYYTYIYYIGNTNCIKILNDQIKKNNSGTKFPVENFILVVP